MGKRPVRAAATPPVSRVPARAPVNPRGPMPRRRGVAYLWIITILVLLLPWIYATLIVFFLGMLPTLVALVIDRTPQKYAAACVASVNFAGVFPYLLKLWQGSQTLDAAGRIITDVFVLFVMYGAAAFGWMLFMAIPPVVQAFLAVLDQRRVALLRANQKRIVEEWGEGVARPQETAEKGERKKSA